MIRELVLATRNKHKAEELAVLLGNLGITIRTLDEFPDVPEVIEDGDTCEANAIKKACAIARFTGLLAVADDTGLEVDALGGRPGVYAARYAGEDATYEDNCQKLLLDLVGVPKAQRTARFLTAAALALPDGRVQVAQGMLEGLITEEPIGHRGFGYDPVFQVQELGRTLAELTAGEKNSVSHRATAFAKVREFLKRVDQSAQLA